MPLNNHFNDYTLYYSWVKPYLPEFIVADTMLTADRDLMRTEANDLVKNYKARVVDWESGAIAFIARINNTRCLILRGVSDLVSDTGSKIYGNPEVFELLAYKVMKKLLNILIPMLNELLSDD